MKNWKGCKKPFGDKKQGIEIVKWIVLKKEFWTGLFEGEPWRGKDFKPM